MITIKKDFKDLKKQKDYLRNNRIYSDIEYIHKYDRQRLKSLLNEQISIEGTKYIFVKEKD